MEPVQVKNYQVVRFMTQGRSLKKSIDIIPRGWFLVKSKQIKCYYPPTKTNKEKIDLQSMVKRKAPPKREWKIYSVHILAAANTYSRAETKVTDLEKKPYAFTDDGDPEGQVAKLNSDMRVFLMKQKNDTTDSSTDELEVGSIQNSVTDEKHDEHNDATDSSTELEGGSIQNSVTNEKHDEHNDAINDYTPTRDNDVTASMNLDQDYIVTDSLAEDVFLSEVGLASNQDHKEKYVIKKIDEMSEQIQKLHDMIVNVLESQNSVVKAVNCLTDRCADLECTTKYLQEELSEIKNGTLKDPTTMLKSTLSYLKNKYEISLPMNTESMLKRFEELLDDSTFNDEIVNYMTKLNDNSIKISAKNVISSFLTKDIAVKYTAVRASEKKRIFSLDFPKLYECFKDAILQCKEADLKSTVTAIGNAFAQARDWYGGRPIRVAKKKLQHMILNNETFVQEKKSKTDHRNESNTVNEMIEDSPYNSDEEI